MIELQQPIAYQAEISVAAAIVAMVGVMIHPHPVWVVLASAGAIGSALERWWEDD